ncbi:hydratase [Tetragenococcus koreensis]|uniref:2-keto-4-pentenoate hydratase n=1 Tax=Tetragenococcus koreensis TaxID=290335 RepID=UPI001F2DFE56|nr:hydratase [Tetragenococcus koreensis]MCF1585555.1 hydratase [Tetragenococcus koreensis]MCF1615101.1 hydratase [Tetragenococcus koreensis]MCF1620146.1 hydratase [Tetragenococcus koreensis]MCF1624929.1 hydratase [Tetragenococcus koreensis]MCF1629821.1 hydratase [Tetragenococcus koreensis]
MTAVEKLYQAYKKNTPLKLGELDLHEKTEAYQIQDEVLKLKEKDGEKLAGYKISLTSKETQNLFASDSPLYGGMTDVTIKNTVSLQEYNSPLLELELVFLVDEPIFPSDSPEKVFEKCRLAPGIEVPDGRYEGWFPKATLYEVVADGAVNGAVAMGEPQKFTYADVDNVKATLTFGNEFVKEGPSTEVLGHPANAVVCLAKELEKHGKKIETGQFISSGTFVLPEPLKKGHYKAEFENVGTVNLEVTD